MSLNEAKYCPVDIQEHEETEDDEFIKSDEDNSFISAKLECENGPDDSSYDRPSEFNNFENNIPLYPIKQEPEDSGDDVQPVVAENLPLKVEEIDVEEHKPGCELLIGSSSNVKLGLAQCDSVKESELRPSDVTIKWEKLYNCVHCPYKTNLKGNVVQHYKYKHSKDAEVYKCQECSYETKNKSDLTRHFKCKHDKEAKLYKCQECSFETKWRDAFTKHHKSKHSKKAKVYNCQECSFQTKYKHTFTEHKIKHSKDAEVYKRQECSFETKRKSHFTVHYK